MGEGRVVQDPQTGLERLPVSQTLASSRFPCICAPLNGRIFNAKDVAFNIKRKAGLLDPKTAATAQI